MSATLATIAQPAATKQASASSRLLSTCWAGIARYFLQRAAIGHLRECDDRALQDIGLTRSQMEAAVRGVMTAPDRARLR